MIDGEAIWIKLFHLTDILREMHDNSNCRADTPPLHTTLAQAKVMGTILWGPDEGCSIKEIAEKLHITSGAVSQIVDKVVHEGLVERIAAANDRRSVKVTLSAQGTALHERLNRYFEQATSQLMAGIPQEKINVFNEVLEHMINAEKQINQSKKTEPEK